MGVGARARRTTTEPSADPARYVRGATPPIPNTGGAPSPSRRRGPSRAPTAAKLGVLREVGAAPCARGSHIVPAMKLNDVVALVTGGASGLGAATVRRLAQGGAKVMIVDRDETRGQALAAELGAGFTKADVTDAAQVEAAVAAAGKLGTLRVAVSCAGIGIAARTLDRTGKAHDLDLFKTIVGVNLIGTFNVLRLAAAAIAKADPLEHGERGVIVNT